MRATQPKGEEGKLGLEEYAGGVGPQPRHFQHSFHTSLRDENWSERKTVQAAGQREPNWGVGTAVEHPSSDPADSTLRTNLKLRLAGQYLRRGVGTYRMGGH